MDRLFSFVRLHTLAFLCWGVAFFFWKDYFTHPHHAVTRAELVAFTGTFSQAGTLISLPSGSQSGNYLLLENAARSLNPGHIDDFRAVQQTPKGTSVTVAHSPEVDPTSAGDAAVIFSLRIEGKEHIDTDAQITSYNARLEKKRRDATFTTLGGFALFGLVAWIRKRFLKR
jgi:hypothetical protein